VAQAAEDLNFSPDWRAKLKKSQIWLTLLLGLTVIGAKGGCLGNADKQAPTSAAPSGLLQAPAGGVTQADYFAKLGLGGNYGPHYNAFDTYLGYTNYSDAKNSEMETSVPLDFSK
jgi:hypothetical protein